MNAAMVVLLQSIVDGIRPCADVFRETGESANTVVATFERLLHDERMTPDMRAVLRDALARLRAIAGSIDAVAAEAAGFAADFEDRLRSISCRA